MKACSPLPWTLLLVSILIYNSNASTLNKKELVADTFWCLVQMGSIDKAYELLYSNKKNAPLFYRYAAILEDGLVVPLDLVGATENYLLASKAGYGPASYSYSTLLERSNNLSDKNRETARQYLLRSAEQGDTDGMFSLAWNYHLGRGVKMDIPKAIYWYTKAANKGDKDAQWQLATIYQSTLLGETNSTLALAWQALAMHFGSKEASLAYESWTKDLDTEEQNKVKAQMKKLKSKINEQYTFVPMRCDGEYEDSN
ncbi:MAG: tetratricopeptide repeat protein [Methylacidiphilales bacterium]|nr:tetratricopeptide repeat protein [Candidatus Methylacidiphilales bacterium]